MDIAYMLNLTFDVWSALFNLVLITGVLVSKRHNEVKAQTLTLALIANLGVNVAEVLAYVFRGDPSLLGWWMVRIANFSVFFCNYLLLFFAARFVIRTLEKDGVAVSPVFKRAISGVVLLGILLLVLSRVFGFYYDFDVQNQYFRTTGYVVLAGLPLGVLVALFVLTVRNWRYLTKIEQISIVMFETLPFVALLCQFFTYGISLTTIANTMSLTMMFMAYEIEVSREVMAKERRMLEEIIAALAEAVDAKDTYTRGHSGRVARYSRMLAERMGLDSEQVETIYRMAMLHDVGKIGVPDAVLNKPGKLTDEEFDLIKSHAPRGGEILGKVRSMPELATGARWHHERYDGRGYPDGIAGEEIPLEARIICVADCYDAMTSDRVYRKHLPQDVVRQEMERCAGTQFDPAVARAMVEIIDEDEDYRLHE